MLYIIFQIIIDINKLISEVIRAICLNKDLFLFESSWIGSKIKDPIIGTSKSNVIILFIYFFIFILRIKH